MKERRGEEGRGGKKGRGRSSPQRRRVDATEMMVMCT